MTFPGKPLSIIVWGGGIVEIAFDEDETDNVGYSSFSNGQTYNLTFHNVLSGVRTGSPEPEHIARGKDNDGRPYSIYLSFWATRPQGYYGHMFHYSVYKIYETDSNE